jgi:DNA-binding beta-propeller fold protein YncE
MASTELSSDAFQDALIRDLVLRARLLDEAGIEQAERYRHDPARRGIVHRHAFLPDPASVGLLAIEPVTGEIVARIPLVEADPPPDASSWSRPTDGNILVMSPREPGISGSIRLESGAHVGLLPSPRGGFLYPGLPLIRERSPRLASLPASQVPATAVSHLPIDLAVSSSGEFILAMDRGGGTVHVVVAQTAAQSGGIQLRAAGSRRPMGLASHGRQVFLTDGITSRLTVLDCVGLKVRHQIFPTGALGGASVTPDGSILVMTFTRPGDQIGLVLVQVSDLRVRHLMNLPLVRGDDAHLEQIAIAPDGGLLYVLGTGDDRKPRIVALDPARRQVIAEIPLETRPVTMAFPPPPDWLPPPMSLSDALVGAGLVSAAALEALQEPPEVPTGPLSDPAIDPMVLGQLPERLIRSMGMVPLHRDAARLTVAMVRMDDAACLQLAQQLAGGLQLRLVSITAGDLEDFLTRRYPGLMASYQALRQATPIVRPPGTGAQGPLPGPRPAPMSGGPSPAAPGPVPGPRPQPAAGPQAGPVPGPLPGPVPGPVPGPRPGPPPGPAPFPAASASQPEPPATESPTLSGSPSGSGMLTRPVPDPAVAPAAEPAPAVRSSVRPLSARASLPPGSCERPVSSEGHRVLAWEPLRRIIQELDRSRESSWSWQNVVAASVAYLPGGHLLACEVQQGHVLELDPVERKVVWSYAPPPSADGALRAPRWAGRTGEGTTLVADTGNHRVLELDAAGVIVRAIGERARAGCTGGALFKPHSVQRLPDGNTLVADTGNHRVIEIDGRGEIVWQYGNASNRLGGNAGSGPDQLHEPTWAWRLSGGTTLVADSGNHRVLELDDDGNVVWSLRLDGGTGARVVRDVMHAWRLEDGRTIVFGRKGLLEWTEPEGLTWEYVFTSQEAIASRPARPARADEPAPSRPQVVPAAVIVPGPRASSPEAAVPPAAPPSSATPLPLTFPATWLVCERQANRLFEIDRAQQLVWEHRGGQGADRLLAPHSAARLPSGATLVADTGHHRVIEIRDGHVVWQHGHLGESGTGGRLLDQPRWVERTPRGGWLIADAGNRRVIELDGGSDIRWHVDGLRFPVHATRLPGGHTLVVEWGGHRVLEVNEQGRPVWSYGQLDFAGTGTNQLFHPEFAFRLADGNTLICDTQNHRVIEVTSDREIVWQYGGPGFLGRKGRFGMQFNTPVSAWRLPDGETRVHHAGKNHLVEILPDLEIAWHHTLMPAR